jgi:hypothetical protein
VISPIATGSIAVVSLSDRAGTAMTVAQTINARMEGLLMAYLQEMMIGVPEKCCPYSR